MSRHLLGKNFDVFILNSTFFIQILMIILKIDVALKTFLATQLFFESNFFSTFFAFK